MGIFVGQRPDIVTKVIDLSDVPLGDLSASADAALAKTLPPIIPSAPDDERTPVSAFNSCI
jgi:hypothetical protein